MIYGTSTAKFAAGETGALYIQIISSVIRAALAIPGARARVAFIYIIGMTLQKEISRNPSGGGVRDDGDDWPKLWALFAFENRPRDAFGIDLERGFRCACCYKRMIFSCGEPGVSDLPLLFECLSMNGFVKITQIVKNFGKMYRNV